jgi:hypothetical protein
MGRPRRQDFAPADFAAKGSRDRFEIVWKLRGGCAISGAGRRPNRSGVSFCAHRSCTGRFRALGEAIDEIAKPPAIFAIAYSYRRRNFLARYKRRQCGRETPEY